MQIPEPRTRKHINASNLVITSVVVVFVLLFVVLLKSLVYSTASKTWRKSNGKRKTKYNSNPVEEEDVKMYKSSKWLLWCSFGFFVCSLSDLSGSVFYGIFHCCSIFYLRLLLYLTLDFHHSHTKTMHSCVYLLLVEKQADSVLHTWRLNVEPMYGEWKSIGKDNANIYFDLLFLMSTNYSTCNICRHHHIYMSMIYFNIHF